MAKGLEEPRITDSYGQQDKCWQDIRVQGLMFCRNSPQNTRNYLRFVCVNAGKGLHRDLQPNW